MDNDSGYAGPVDFDPFDLDRFVTAQAGSYDDALAELRAGRRRSHWMWFVLPQLPGLGRSQMAQHYAVSGLDEARAYLAHPLLGPRLVECARTLAGLQTDDAGAVLGPVDAQKLHSSMTLFARADARQPPFQHVLDRYFDGEPDRATLALLGHRNA